MVSISTNWHIRPALPPEPRYLPGGTEVWIVISAQDLGITDWLWAKVCGDYKLKASTIFHKMDQQHQKVQYSGKVKAQPTNYGHPF
jgi:hypothetical protein